MQERTTSWGTRPSLDGCPDERIEVGGRLVALEIGRHTVELRSPASLHLGGRHADHRQPGLAEQSVALRVGECLTLVLGTVDLDDERVSPGRRREEVDATIALGGHVSRRQQLVERRLRDEPPRGVGTERVADPGTEQGFLGRIQVDVLVESDIVRAAAERCRADVDGDRPLQGGRDVAGQRRRDDRIAVPEHLE